MKLFLADIDLKDLRDRRNVVWKKRRYYSLWQLVRALWMFLALENCHVAIRLDVRVSLEPLDTFREH